MKDVIYPSTANLYGYVSAYVSVIDIEIGSTNYDKVAVNKLGFDRFYQHKLVKEVLAKYKNNPNGLSVDGCASPDAIRLKNYMESFAFDANAEDVTATGGVNTGIKPNGEVIYYDGKNITGNLDSIKVTYKLQDGTLIPVYELRRCANPVFSHKHRHHKDHDDDRDRDKPKCKSGQTWNGKVCLTKKDPKADPAQKGNAPKGSGKNQDPGPGAYQAPNEVTKPSSEPRVNPAPPTTSTSSSSSSSSIPKGSTPDPAPAPAPEKAAPTPSKPATGTVSVPGM